MLTGPELGAAIESARKLKKVTKKAMADHFGVQPPSVQDWVKRGTIDKEKLQKLWAYFAGVVGPEHWGLANWQNAQHAGEGVAPYTVAHDVSQAQSKVLPLQIEWDTIMQGSLPDQFVLPLRDTALQPRFASATRIIFATGRTAQPGDVVLLRDSAGDHYIREYHLVRAGH